MLSIEVGGKVFPVPREILLKSPYFELLLSLDPEKIVVNRSRRGFRHVLEFLYDDNYSFPATHFHELDFYGVPYHHYSAERNDKIDVYIRGVKFKLQAKHLILNSKYFEKELPQLYVGQDLHIDRDPVGFRHILNRMSDCHYIVPRDYRKERKFYGVQEIVWLDKTIVTINNFGSDYRIFYQHACRSPYLKSFLDKEEALPPFSCIQEGFERVIQYLRQSANARLALIEDEFIYQLLQLKPDRYFIESWKPCCSVNCNALLKHLDSKDGWSAGRNRFYCPKHTCAACEKERKSDSNYCTDHTCSSKKCIDQVVKDGKCEKHK